MGRCRQIQMQTSSHKATCLHCELTSTFNFNQLDMLVQCPLCKGCFVPESQKGNESWHTHYVKCPVCSTPNGVTSTILKTEARCPICYLIFVPDDRLNEPDDRLDEGCLVRALATPVQRVSAEVLTNTHQPVLSTRACWENTETPFLSCTELASFLRENDVNEEVVQRFLDEGFEGESALVVDERDLTALGVTNAQRLLELIHRHGMRRKRRRHELADCVQN